MAARLVGLEAFLIVPKPSATNFKASFQSTSRSVPFAYQWLGEPFRRIHVRPSVTTFDTKVAFIWTVSRRTHPHNLVAFLAKSQSVHPRLQKEHVVRVFLSSNSLPVPTNHFDAIAPTGQIEAH